MGEGGGMIHDGRFRLRGSVRRKAQPPLCDTERTCFVAYGIIGSSEKRLRRTLVGVEQLL